MSFGRLVIRHVACVSPAKKPAVVQFAAGPNAIIGLSNTGKSYVLELIDFMLGADELSREIPEAGGYDTVLLGLQAGEETFTLRRSLDGGDFEVLDGLVEQRGTGQVLETLTLKERKKGPRTVSQFYLDKLGLTGTVLRQKKSATQNLTIRTLANLVLVSETRIIAERSPILSGQFTGATPEKSLFKFVLSGVDDSALIAYVTDAKAAEDNLARLTAGQSLLEDRRELLKERGVDESSLRTRLGELEGKMALVRSDAGEADADLLAVRRRIRRIVDTRDLAERRIGELDTMLARFNLLDAHYVSDLARLQAIAEAATSLDTLAPGPCPLCGATPTAQKHDEVCEADLPALAEAANAEAQRIAKLRNDLAQTIKQTDKEQRGLQKRLADAARQNDLARTALAAADAAARQRRVGFVDLSEQVAAIKDGLREFDVLRDMETRLAKLKEEVDETGPEMPDVSAPRTFTDGFAHEVASILAAWKVPGCDRVSFDAKASDIQLNDKLRGSQGKGLRALTHAAFVIGLMTYCLKNDRPHPGFVVIDSPLLSYRGDEVDEPEQALKKTSVDEAFYFWIATQLSAGQVIVIENREAPKGAREQIRVHDFMGVSGHRQGFFPSS